MDEQTRSIRDAIQHHRSDRTQKPQYPADLRAAVVAYAAARREKGDGVHLIAKDLGFNANTLYGWLGEKGKGAAAGLRAVDVVATRGRSGGAGGTVTMVTPRGLRIEGLSVHEMAVLLRALS